MEIAIEDNSIKVSVWNCTSTFFCSTAEQVTLREYQLAGINFLLNITWDRNTRLEKPSTHVSDKGTIVVTDSIVVKHNAGILNRLVVCIHVQAFQYWKCCFDGYVRSRASYVQLNKIEFLHLKSDSPAVILHAETVVAILAISQDF